jgi:hypothetical protein
MAHARESIMQQHSHQSAFAKRYVRQGIEHGYRTVLRTQLQQRFGALPADALARLDQAHADTLDAWARRVLTATSLAEVFAGDLE